MKRIPQEWPAWSVAALLMSIGAVVALLDDSVGAAQLTWHHRALDFVLLAVAFPLAVTFVIDRYRRAQAQAAAARDQAVADERRRISRDLHDSLAQQIGYLHLKLDWLTNDHLNPQADAATVLASLRQELEEMRVVSSEAYEQISGVLLELREAGSPVLTEALLSRAKWIGARAGFDVSLTSDGEPQRLVDDKAQQIQYIFREALSNVEKHADARHVDIRVEWQPERLIISLHDNGQGFDAAGPLRPTHFGLEVMHERAARLGGDLQVASVSDRGTTVSLSLPLARILARQTPPPPAGQEILDGRRTAEGLTGR